MDRGASGSPGAPEADQGSATDSYGNIHPSEQDPPRRSPVSPEQEGLAGSQSRLALAFLRRLPLLRPQPYGKDKARESTVISEHPTAAEAFGEIDDRISSEMVRTRAQSNAVELIVIDVNGQIVPRPRTR